MARDKKATLELLEKRNNAAGCESVAPADLRRMALEAQGGRALTTKQIAAAVFDFLTTVMGDPDPETFAAVCVEVKNLGGISIKLEHPDLEKVRFIQVIDAARLPDDGHQWESLDDCQIIQLVCPIGKVLATCVIERPEDPATV